MANNTRTVSALPRLNVTLAGGLAVLFLFSSAPTAFGQVGSQPQRQLGVSVQLPVLRNFSVQTVVRVPDGGTMALGGVSGSASGRVSSGAPDLPGRPWRNAGIGRTTQSARASVRTRIISQREIEAQLMAAADPNKPMDEKQLVRVPADVDALADFLTQHIARSVPPSSARR